MKLNWKVMIQIGVAMFFFLLPLASFSQGAYFGANGSGNVVGRPGNPMVKICPDCDGSGICHNPFCKGRGTWREGNKLLQCSDCKGSKKCKRCAGTGRLN